MLDIDETHYREIDHLVQWWSDNHLVLTTTEIIEVNVDYRTTQRTKHAPRVHGKDPDHVGNIKWLNLHYSDLNTCHLAKEALQRLFFPRRLRPVAPLSYWCLFTEPPLKASPVSVWLFGSPAAQQQAGRTWACGGKSPMDGRKSTTRPLPDLDSVSAGHLQEKAGSRATGPTLPGLSFTASAQAKLKPQRTETHYCCVVLLWLLPSLFCVSSSFKFVLSGFVDLQNRIPLYDDK